MFNKKEEPISLQAIDYLVFAFLAMPAADPSQGRIQTFKKGDSTLKLQLQPSCRS